MTATLQEKYLQLGVRLRLKDDDTNLGARPETAITPEVHAMLVEDKQRLITELIERRKVIPQGSVPKVGQELTRLFEEQNIVLQLLMKKSCGPCKALASHMDHLGVAGCVKNRDCLVTKIHTRAKDNSLILRLFSNDTRKGIEGLFDQAVDNCRMSVVWVYWHGGQENDELRYSMRAAETHLSDVKNFVLCGDQPGWFGGHFIESPRFNRVMAKAKFGSGRFAKWIDSAVKLQKIIDDPNVTENFLWMYDDTFIVQDTSIDELSTPRYRGMLHSGDLEKTCKSAWREVMRRSHRALVNRGMSANNFSTHYPAVFSKTKLRRTLEEFECLEKARVVESIYMNQHHGKEAIPLTVELQYNKRISHGWRINNQATVVNVGGFRGEAARTIQAEYPNQSSCEAE